MAKRTQKAGATARFGARYGVSVRRNAGTALAKKTAKYTCPVCQYRKVRRVSVGIWHCAKCDHLSTIKWMKMNDIEIQDSISLPNFAPSTDKYLISY